MLVLGTLDPSQKKGFQQKFGFCFKDLYVLMVMLVKNMKCETEGEIRKSDFFFFLRKL